MRCSLRGLPADTESPAVLPPRWWCAAAADGSIDITVQKARCHCNISTRLRNLSIDRWLPQAAQDDGWPSAGTGTASGDAPFPVRPDGCLAGTAAPAERRGSQNSCGPLTAEPGSAKGGNIRLSRPGRPGAVPVRPESPARWQAGRKDLRDAAISCGKIWLGQDRRSAKAASARWCQPASARWRLLATLDW